MSRKILSSFLNSVRIVLVSFMKEVGDINKKTREILPGLTLSFLVAVVSKWLANYIPQLGGATIAILLGIILGNTIFMQPELDKGTKFAESRLL